MPEIITPGEVNYPYNAFDLSSEINLIDREWGLINSMGIFRSEPIETTMVEIGMSAQKVVVLAAVERGQDGSRGAAPGENSVILKVPHFNHLETLAPGDLQDRFVFGTGRTKLRKLDVETQKKLLALRRHFRLTREYLSMGALKGLITDGANQSIYNLFTVFKVNKKVIYFNFADVNTDVMVKIEELLNHISDELKGDVMDHVHVLVDSGFFRKMTTHPSVEKYLLQGDAGAQVLAKARLEGKINFEGKIVFEIYRAWATGVDGNIRAFIAANTGHAFPVGTEETFGLYDGPPHHIAFANTEGMEMFVSPHELPHGAGIELKGQANPLPVCKRPGVLVELSAAAGP